MADEFRIQVCLDCLRAAFGPVAGILDASERHLGQSKTVMVYRNHAGFDGSGYRLGSLRRAGVGIGGEAVGQPVRFGDDFVEIAEG